MVKYMKKGTSPAESAATEVSQSTLGIRTRAKTLALQRRLSSAAADSPTLSEVVDSFSYLQLRSRRLEKHKPPLVSHQKPTSRKQSCIPQSQTIPNPTSDGSGPAGSITRPQNEEGVAEEMGNDFDLGVEASLAENNSEFEPRNRSTRESTPCSVIRDVDAAPGSSTRRGAVNAVNQRSRNEENIPSTLDVEAFFGHFTEEHRREFIEKYNFDVVNDVPLPGRYEWVKINNP